MIFLFVASLRVVSVDLVCVYVGEVSVNFDVVLDDEFVSFFLGYFPNGAALKFDVVSVDFSVCFLCFCVLGEGGGGVGLYSTCLELDIFTGASLWG